MRAAPIFALLLFVGMASPLLSAGKGEPAAGKAVYTKKCMMCHGTAGEGKEAIAKMMKVELRHLGAKEVQARSDAELAKSVKEGTGKMKPVAGLTEHELADLICYLRTLKQ